MIGKQLAQYRIEELVGSGGMGVVYRAHDERLGRDVAIKILSTGAFADPDQKKRLRSEARTLSRLNHPNIATVHDFNTIDGVDFLVMEHIEGETLDAHLRGAASPQEIFALGRQIVEAVVAAHDAHIVHRDLKPGNILITRDRRVKVLDFGLARLTASEAGTADHTQEMLESRGMSGTIPYMAPEQLEGGPIDNRTDIHALGIILYEMATGRRPFTGPTSAVVAAIRDQVPKPPALVNAATPKELSDIIMRCLRKKPSERFQTAREVLHSLDASASGGVTPARTRQPNRRNRAIAAAVLVLATVTTIGAWLALGDRTHGEESTPLRSVAILPFRTESESGDNLGIGMADAVVTKISRASSAVIRPTSAVRRYASADVDPIEAGRQLEVDAVLEGSLRRSGPRMRVGLNLVRVRDRISIWSDNFDTDAGDIFAVEDVVAERILGALDVNLTASDRKTLTKRYTTSEPARAAYTQAMTLFDRRIGDHESLRQSITWFRKAIAADPEYALAHANLGYAYLWMGLFAEASDARWLGLAKEELKRAEELDPSLPDVHIARHDLLWSASEGFQIDAALRELGRARELDPTRADSELATILYHLGLAAPTRRALNRSMEIDPTSRVNHYHYVEGMALIGNYDESIRAAKQFGMRPPVYALLTSGRLAEAEAELNERTKNSQVNAIEIALAARLAARKGQPSEATRLIEEALHRAVKSGRTYHHITFEAALVHARLGEAEKAVAYLQETVEFGMPNLPLFEQHPDLQPIRTSPEFAAFLQELRPRWQRYVAAVPS